MFFIASAQADAKDQSSNAAITGAQAHQEPNALVRSEVASK